MYSRLSREGPCCPDSPVGEGRTVTLALTRAPGTIPAPIPGPTHRPRWSSWPRGGGGTLTGKPGKPSVPFPGGPSSPWGRDQSCYRGNHAGLDVSRQRGHRVAFLSAWKASPCPDCPGDPGGNWQAKHSAVTAVTQGTATKEDAPIQLPDQHLHLDLVSLGLEPRASRGLRQPTRCQPLKDSVPSGPSLTLSPISPGSPGGPAGPEAPLGP